MNIRIHILLAAVLTLAACTGKAPVETVAGDASASYLMLDGKRGTLPVLRSEQSDGSVLYRVVRDSIPDNMRTLALKLEFATAHTGDEGWWLKERGELGYFNRTDMAIGNARNWLRLPYFAMKTPERTFFAIIEGMRFEYDLKGGVKDSVYTFYPEWVIYQTGFGAYEDPSIRVYDLPADADYNDMAKLYRRYKEERDPEIKPIKERMKGKPHLEKLANSLALRQIGARKGLDKQANDMDFTPETEHPAYCVVSFEESLRLLRKMKNELGMDDVAVCVAGWQTGGYDGRGPSAFPVCEEAGGEEALKALVKGGQELGYIMDAHSNYTDAFTVSPRWDNGNIVCVNHEGKLDSNGVWDGGKAYNVCLKHAWDTFIKEDFEHLSEIGFYGCHYIDVFTAGFPYRCCNPAHPATRADAAGIQREIAAYCRDHFGGFSSECCFDHLIGYLDYLNYTQRAERDRRTSLANGKRLPTGATWDELVPFFELAFHDVVLANPDKVTQEVPEGDDYLMLVEFGGRPIIYSFSEENLPDIKRAYDRFQPLKHLMTEEMVSHHRIAPGVACVTYGNRERVVVNYNTEAFTFEGTEIPAKDYRIIPAPAGL